MRQPRTSCAVALAVEGTLIAGRARRPGRAAAVPVGARPAGRRRRAPRSSRCCTRWLVGNADTAAVVTVLRRSRRTSRSAAWPGWRTAYVTFERQQILAPLLRREPWVQRDAARTASRDLLVAALRRRPAAVDRRRRRRRAADRRAALAIAVRRCGWSPSTPPPASAAGWSTSNSTGCRRGRTRCRRTSSRRSARHPRIVAAGAGAAAAARGAGRRR